VPSGFTAGRLRARSEKFERRALHAGEGSAALSLCTTAHPLHTRFTNIFDASVSEATMRLSPSAGRRRSAGGQRGAGGAFAGIGGASIYASMRTRVFE
jgi:hypothetical protein